MPLPALLERHRPGQRIQTGLARVIVRGAGLGQVRVSGGHVHDGAATLGDHHFANLATHDHGAGEVGGHDTVPLGRRRLRHRSVVVRGRTVDQDVDATHGSDDLG